MMWATQKIIYVLRVRDVDAIRRLIVWHNLGAYFANMAGWGVETVFKTVRNLESVESGGDTVRAPSCYICCGKRTRNQP